MISRHSLDFVKNMVSDYDKHMIIVNGANVNTYEKWKERELNFNDKRQKFLEAVISEMESAKDPLEKILIYKEFRDELWGGYGRTADQHLIHTLVSEVLNESTQGEEKYKWEYVDNEYRYQYGPVLARFELNTLSFTLHDRASLPYMNDYSLNINPVRKELLDELKDYMKKPIRVPSKKLLDKCMEWIRNEPRNKRSFTPEEDKAAVWDFRKQFLGICLSPKKGKKFIERLEYQEEQEIVDREAQISNEKERKEKIENAQNVVISSGLAEAVNRFRSYPEFSVRVTDWFPEV